MPNPISFPPLQPTYSANVFQRNIFLANTLMPIFLNKIFLHTRVPMFFNKYSAFWNKPISTLVGSQGQDNCFWWSLLQLRIHLCLNICFSILTFSRIVIHTAIFMVKKMMLLLDDVDRIRIKFRLFWMGDSGSPR